MNGANIHFKNYKGILLDLDNTLYNYEKCHKAAIEKALGSISESVGVKQSILEEAFNAARKELHIELSNSASSHNRMLYFQRMFERIGLNPLTYTLEAYNLYWDHFLDILDYDEGAEDFLKSLKGKQICLITDLTVHIQHRKIQKLKLDRYIDAIVTSEEAGREKPHPYIFLLALKKLGLSPSEIIMVGDNYSRDVLGAVNLGISCIWLNREKKSECSSNKLVTEIQRISDLMKYV
ncbi:MAG: HAD family hydrolase [Cytophagaceae bacterium]